MMIRGISVLSCAMLILANCGGGGDGPLSTSPEYSSFSTGEIKSAAEITVLTITPENKVSVSVGEIDGLTSGVTLDGVTGTFDESSLVLTFSSGTTIELGTMESDFVRLQTLEDINGGQLGIIGFPTLAEDMPTGPKHYALPSGSKLVITSNGTDLLELEGQTTAQLDFDTGDYTVAISDLDGTWIKSNGQRISVTNAVEVNITGTNAGSGGFSNGEIELLNSNLAEIDLSLSGNEVSRIHGDLFGPQASEMGGTFVVDDTAHGTIKMQGAFVGKEIP